MKKPQVIGDALQNVCCKKKEGKKKQVKKGYYEEKLKLKSKKQKNLNSDDFISIYSL